MRIFDEIADSFEFMSDIFDQTQPLKTNDTTVPAAPSLLLANMILGTFRDDILDGSSDDDLILGLGGGDEIQGRLGSDTIVGGPGSDLLFGNGGHDTVVGGAGRDVLSAGNGQDRLTGGTQNDTFILGDGFNVITDFEVGIDTIFVPNMARDLIAVTQLGDAALITYSGSSTTVLNASAEDVSAAIKVQTSGFVQINEDGWGDSQEVYAWSQEVFDEYLYVSTLNLDGTQSAEEITGAGGLYRYDGTTGLWETISQDGLGNPENDGIRNLIVFNDMLYAGTLNTGEGAELLRSADGINFETVISEGFDRPGLGSVRALYEFEDVLYVGFQSIIKGEPLLLLRSEDGVTFDEVSLPGEDRFNFANNNSLHSLTEYDGYLYAGTRNPTNGFELYRSADGIVWETVIGPGADIGSGFDGSANTQIYHMIEFQGALYIGTGNFSEGFEVHRSFDGVTFEQIGENGFGDSGNNFAWRFHIFEDELYLGTNFDGAGFGGGSVFRTSDGENWETLVGIEGQFDRPGFNDTVNWGIRSFETYQGELFIGTANFPYAEAGVDDTVGAQVFQYLGEPEPETPEYFF